MREILIKADTPIADVRKLGTMWSGEIGTGNHQTLDITGMEKAIERGDKRFRKDSLCTTRDMVMNIMAYRDPDVARVKELYDSSEGKAIREPTIWVDLEEANDGIPVMVIVDGIHRVLVNAANAHWFVDAWIIKKSDLDDFLIKVFVETPDGRKIDASSPEEMYKSYGRYTDSDGNVRG